MSARLRKGLMLLLGLVMGMILLIMSPFLIPLFLYFVQTSGNFGLLLLNIAIYGVILGFIAMIVFPIFLGIKKAKRLIS